VHIDPYRSHLPQVDDIVVFHVPAGAASGSPVCGTSHPAGAVCARPTSQEASIIFIKRIVAGPGDTIAVDHGNVVLNGKLQKEPFIQPCNGGEGCNFPRPVKIPAGYWFLMGDNRGQSDDSRFWGPVPVGWIVGKVVSHT
jgi:signal peptidase I